MLISLAHRPQKFLLIDLDSLDKTMQLIQTLSIVSLVLVFSELTRLWGPIFFFSVSSKKLFPNHQIKANSKIQSLNSFTKPIIMKKPAMSPKLDANEDDDQLVLVPSIEIFVRKYSVGLWIRLKKKCIYCGIPNETTVPSPAKSDEYYYDNTHINKMFADLNNVSGIEEEVLRDEIDKWISLRLFTDAGLGGERNFIQQVRALLPQFKSLKPKEFEFGYRYISYDDASESFFSNSLHGNLENKIDRNQPNRVVYSLISKERERISAKISKSTTEYENQMSQQSADWNISDMLQLYSATIKDDRESLQPLLTSSQQKVHDHIQSVADGMFQSLQQSQSSSHCSHLDIFFDGSAYFSKSKVSDDSSKSATDMLCVKAGAGVYIVPRDDEAYALSPRVAARNGWPICVHSASQLVSTPFDAELLAGLTAVTVLSRILTNYALTKQAPSVAIFSDSKTMCRVFRLINNKSSKPDESESLPLYSRGEGSRQLMWDVLCDHVRYILKSVNTRGSGSEYDLARWVAGHPERTKLSKEWTFYDTGIWSADEIARGSEGLMNVLNIRSNTADASKITALSETDESDRINNSVEDDSQPDSAAMDDDTTAPPTLAEDSKGRVAPVTSSQHPLHLDVSASDLLMYSVISVVRE